MLSMNGLKVGKYIPNSTIKTDPLSVTYTIENNIGRGKFAVVKKCIHNETKEVVAAKFIKKRRKGKSCREEILREVVMLEQALAHPRLVDLLEVYESPHELILVTEYCAGGELFQECVIEESFREHDVIRFLIQILEGLTYLHERNIVHLDLKPQNILLTEPFPAGNIKICDLGFACLVNTGEDIRDIIGTPDYVAPEVLDYEPLGTATDMWSLGALTYVMLTACSPFAGDNNQETFCNISQVKLDFPDSLFGHISPAAQDFMKRLLVKDPRKRLTARQCLEHEWLKASVIAATVPSIPSPSDAAFSISQDLESTVNYSRRPSISDASGTLPQSPESIAKASPRMTTKRCHNSEVSAVSSADKSTLSKVSSSSSMEISDKNCQNDQLSGSGCHSVELSNNHCQNKDTSDTSNEMPAEVPQSLEKSSVTENNQKNVEFLLDSSDSAPLDKKKDISMETGDISFELSENDSKFSQNDHNSSEAKESTKFSISSEFSFVKTLTMKIENKNKRHSMEIPMKKHKCNDDMEVNDSGFCSENVHLFSNNGSEHDEEMNNGDCAGQHLPCSNKTSSSSINAQLCVQNDSVSESIDSSDIESSSTYIHLETCSDNIV